MKKTFISLTVFLSVVSSCEHKQDETRTSTLAEDPVCEAKIISLATLRGNQQDYLDREVTVATYLFTHEEGAWIGDYPDKPLINTLSLKIDEGSKLVAASTTQFRWWFKYQEGFQIIISGVYRLGDWTAHGRPIENHPFLEVVNAKEVSPDDAVWQAKRTKPANKSWMSTAHNHLNFISFSPQ